MKQGRSSSIGANISNKWIILKKKTLKKNPSNRKPISYSTEFRLGIYLNNVIGKLCAAMINAFQGILCYTYFAFLNEIYQREDIMKA